MWVASNLPHGLIVEHNGVTMTINGSNVGFDPENLAKNGLPPDTAARFHGHGLTELTGAEADAFKDWFKISGQGHGPVQSGAIVIAQTEVDAKKAAAKKDSKQPVAGIDPETDLPAGLETKKDD